MREVGAISISRDTNFLTNIPPIVNPVGDMYVLLAGEVDIETDLGVVQVPSLKMKQPALCRGLNQQKKQNMGNRDQTMVTKCSYPWLINHWSHLIINIVTINWLISHWRFPKMVVPPLKFKMENPNNKCMILEVPLFEETPIWGKKGSKG